MKNIGEIIMSNKGIIGIITAILLSMLLMVGCGGGGDSSAAPIDNSESSNNGSEAVSQEETVTTDEETLDGEWSDGYTDLTIEGDKGLLNWGGSSNYKLTIDTSKKTITAKAYSWDESDVVYEYDFIGGKLVLTTDNDQALNDSTLAFERK